MKNNSLVKLKRYREQSVIIIPINENKNNKFNITRLIYEKLQVSMTYIYKNAKDNNLIKVLIIVHKIKKKIK